MSATTSEASSPETRTESRGSSVSTGLREEYEDLLRYAVVTPKIEGLLAAKPAPILKPQQQPPPPSGSLPPRPHTPPRHASRGRLQPELSRVESEEGSVEVPGVSEAPFTSQSPVLKPPPPFTAMNIHVQHTSHTVPPPMDMGSHEPLSESHDLSIESHDESREEESIQPLGVDPEMVRLETQMDMWCLDLKRNVLAEFDQARIRMIERQQADLHRERQQHAYELQQLQEELERYKELLVTYEQSISRKDHIIANLTKALQKQKERVDLGRSFSSWKIRHIDDKRETFTSSLARRHHQRRVKSRVWAAWFGLIQGRWKQRTEKACQNKAEEVCMQLTGEYEERLAAVQRSFDESQQEVVSLRAERDLYEENMKKAFMRGICALNLEAMSMFRPNEPTMDPTGCHSNGDSSDRPRSPPPPPQGDIHIPHYQRPPPSKMIHVTTTAAPGGTIAAQQQSSVLPQDRLPHSTGPGGHARSAGGVGRNVRGSSSRKGLHSRTPHQKPAVVVERHVAGTSEQ